MSDAGQICRRPPAPDAPQHERDQYVVETLHALDKNVAVLAHMVTGHQRDLNGGDGQEGLNTRTVRLETKMKVVWGMVIAGTLGAASSPYWFPS